MIKARVMIKAMAYTDVANDDVENFVITILKGIELADRISTGYSLEITRDDVAVLAKVLKHITNVEVSCGGELMTNKECLHRIAKLVEELAIVDITKDEYLKALKDASFNEIADEIWQYYCFVCDIKSTLMEVRNGKDSTSNL